MQILVQVRERLGVDMSTADFFALPTVASQARFVETRAPNPSVERCDPS